MTDDPDDPDDGSLADDPVYRAGVLMGRQRSITDVIEILLDPDGGLASTKLATLMEWCVQAQEEGKIELQLVVSELRARDD